MFDKDQARKMIIGRKNVNQELMKEKKPGEKKNQDKRKTGEKKIRREKKTGKNEYRDNKKRKNVKMMRKPGTKIRRERERKNPGITKN